jgi:DeoR/GlpR family transcriptional regulator of sugar metabolism
VAKHIKDRTGLTVITNATAVIGELANCTDMTIICTGGTLRNKSLSFVGRAAENTLSGYHADKAFLSCKGFSPDKGLTDSNEQESDIRKLIIKCSKKVVFLCDHTKFDKVGYVTTANLEDIDCMICDKELPPGWEEALKNASVELKITKNTNEN